MDFWIRSQDKEMFRINPELEIYEDKNKDYLILDTKGNTDYYCAKILGAYKTKERALEVLDEIQEFKKELNTSMLYSNVPIEDFEDTYEMPEK